MIAILRADDTRNMMIGDAQVEVPDLKIPKGVKWSADLTDHGVPVFALEHNEQTATLLLAGPYPIGPGTYYIATAPRGVLQFLANQIGPGNAMLLIDALRQSSVLRTWAKGQGFALIRNSAGKPVGVMPPLTICGHPPSDLDGQDPDEAPELLDLEG